MAVVHSLRPVLTEYGKFTPGRTPTRGVHPTGECGFSAAMQHIIPNRANGKMCCIANGPGEVLLSGKHGFERLTHEFGFVPLA